MSMLLLLIGYLWLLPAFVPLCAASELVKPGSAEQAPIQITADRLESSRQESYAEFAGNVEVVQNQFKIQADRLRVYYKKEVGSKKPAASKDAIEKIVALGNVKIQTDTAQAQADKAEYRVQEGVFTLKGDNSTVASGKNTITGSQITFNQQNGNISVKGQAGQRVRAVFYPEEKNFSLPDNPSKVGAPTSPPDPTHRVPAR